MQDNTYSDLKPFFGENPQHHSKKSKTESKKNHAIENNNTISIMKNEPSIEETAKSTSTVSASVDTAQNQLPIPDDVFNYMISNFLKNDPHALSSLSRTNKKYNQILSQDKIDTILNMTPLDDILLEYPRLTHLDLKPLIKQVNFNGKKARALIMLLDEIHKKGATRKHNGHRRFNFSPLDELLYQAIVNAIQQQNVKHLELLLSFMPKKTPLNLGETKTFTLNNKDYTYDYATPICQAAATGNLKIVTLLINKGADNSLNFHVIGDDHSTLYKGPGKHVYIAITICDFKMYNLFIGNEKLRYDILIHNWPYLLDHAIAMVNQVATNNPVEYHNLKKIICDIIMRYCFEQKDPFSRYFDPDLSGIKNQDAKKDIACAIAVSVIMRHLETQKKLSAVIKQIKKFSKNELAPQDFKKIIFACTEQYDAHLNNEKLMDTSKEVFMNILSEIKKMYRSCSMRNTIKNILNTNNKDISKAIIKSSNDEFGDILRNSKWAPFFKWSHSTPLICSQQKRVIDHLITINISNHEPADKAKEMIQFITNELTSVRKNEAESSAEKETYKKYEVQLLKILENTYELLINDKIDKQYEYKDTLKLCVSILANNAITRNQKVENTQLEQKRDEDNTTNLNKNPASPKN